MPDNTKDPKQKKFVSSELTEETETPSKDEVPKVSSFSQLDASKSDIKASTTETALKTTSAEKKDMSSEDIKDWLKDVRPDTNKEVEKKGGPNFNVLLILVLITAVLGGSF